MKRSLIILGLLFGIVAGSALISRHAGAQRSLFRTGSPDELANAKAISLDYLRSMTSRRAVGSADDFIFNRVEVDETGTAHSHV